MKLKPGKKYKMEKIVEILKIKREELDFHLNRLIKLGFCILIDDLNLLKITDKANFFKYDLHKKIQLDKSILDLFFTFLNISEVQAQT